jgi:hypothetical protein
MPFYVLAIIMAVINAAALPAAPIIPWFWVIAAALVPAGLGLLMLAVAGIVFVFALFR